MTINQQTAEDLLRHDLVRFEDGITNLVKKPLNQNQFDALVCFSYNVGLGNLKSSTLLKDINAGLYKPAAEQFVKWDRAGGVEVAGLLRRRTAEQILFKSPVT
jgi:lysozyme